MDEKTASLFSDERNHTPPNSSPSYTAACGRPTTISLGDGRTLDLEPGLRVVAFVVSRTAEDKSLSDLAAAAAVCRDNGTLVHQLDDLLVCLPPGAGVGAAFDREASWHKSLGAALQNVDVVATSDAWDRRQAAEALHAGFAILDWGSTGQDIVWNRLGLSTGRIAAIRDHVRELRRGRRTLDECHFLLAVLTQPGPPGHEAPLGQLLAAVDADAVRLFAGDVAAAYIPILSRRGYRWSPGLNGAPKGFFVDRARDVAPVERRFLAQLLGLDEVDLLERPLPASERYRLP